MPRNVRYLMASMFVLIGKSIVGAIIDPQLGTGRAFTIILLAVVG